MPDELRNQFTTTLPNVPTNPPVILHLNAACLCRLTCESIGGAGFTPYFSALDRNRRIASGHAGMGRRFAQGALPA